MTAAYFQLHPTDPEKVILRKPPLDQEPPKYSFKAHWEKDGRIGVVAAIVRSDGGVHILEDIIDMPQRTWVDLTDEEIDALHMQAKLKEKNT